jgi:NADPH:quinone reductase-like Zn-dependent oxidoreductase
MEDVPTPSPRAGEVLVKVHAVSVNRSLDLDVRAGIHYSSELPLILGVDPSGEVVEVGPGVTDFKAGDHVAATNFALPCGECATCLDGRQQQCASRHIMGQRAWGGYAEFIRLPTLNIVLLPEKLPYADATVVCRHFPTAQAQIDRAALKPDEWCLIMGAAGALGTCLIQLTKMMGVKTIVAAGADERVNTALGLGGDYGINYRTQDLEQEVRRITEGRGVDVVFENIGDPVLWPGAFNSMKPGGRLATVGAHGGEGVHLDVRRLYTLGLSVLGGPGMGTLRDYERCLQMAVEGKIKAVIDRIVPLSQAVEAHKLVEVNEPIGKVILDPTLDQE